VTTDDTSEQSEISGLASADIALSDPLKEETRKARLYLLGVSIVGITIVKTGLVPQEITTLGIKFGDANRQSLLSILALVTLYFLAAFAIYGISDFFAWRYAYGNARWTELLPRLDRHYREMAEELDGEALRAEQTQMQQHELLQRQEDERRRRAHEMHLAREAFGRLGQMSLIGSPYVSNIRAFFEFFLPLFVGGYAVFALLTA
jgi:hypothetical protein